MPEFLSPGVFIEEVASGNQTIQAVGTSTMALVGWTKKGPANKATLVTGLDGFIRTFGDFTRDSHIPMSVAAYFANGGTRIYMVRVVPSAAVAATVAIPGLWTLNAASPGAWGNDVKVTLQGNASTLVYGQIGVAGAGSYAKYDLIVSEKNSAGVYEVKEAYEELELTDSSDAMYFPEVVNDASDILSVVEIAPGAPASMEGVEHATTATTPSPVFNGTITATTVTLTPAHAPLLKTSLKLTLTDGVNVSNYVADTAGNISLSTSTGTAITLNTSLVNKVNWTTGVITLNFTAAPSALAVMVANYISQPTASIEYVMTTGSDGTISGLSRTEFTAPTLVADKKGMYALNRIDEMMQLCIPDFAGDTTMAGDQIDYAEGRRDIFVILSTKAGVSAQDAVDYRRITLGRNTKYAAMYWPWIKVSDPLNNNRPSLMPPMAHIAGVYARTDVTRNVGKAPGGTVDGALRFLVGLESNPDKGERDTVSPAGINSLINTPQTGMAVWGVRTLSAESEWRYINASRLFMFVEKSVFNATHWAVFESIGAGLYNRIKTQLEGFLNGLYGTGHFAGRSPTEAFFVVCDPSNNPPAVVNAGQVVVDVAMAPNKPGEFVRFRFSQKTLS